MRRGTVLLAFGLILVGTYCLLIELGLDIPGFDHIWPVFPFAGGIVLFCSYLIGHRQSHERVFWGTALALSGLLFSLFTSGPEPDYSALPSLWPMFVIIAGISFLALWLSQGFKDGGILFLAVVGIAFGSMAMIVRIRPHVVTPEVMRLWPVLPILVGLILLARGLLEKKEVGQ